MRPESAHAGRADNRANAQSGSDSTCCTDNHNDAHSYSATSRSDKYADNGTNSQPSSGASRSSNRTSGSSRSDHCDSRG